MVLGTDI